MSDLPIGKIIIDIFQGGRIGFRVEGPDIFTAVGIMETAKQAMLAQRMGAQPQEETGPKLQVVRGGNIPNLKESKH